ncbi:TRAP transporter large permease [Virgibacillus sp. W0181]|uniref:TRAP transporter large permease n=1 Tax=Virgibacillus sp. W0181 TaxID=3391581 RepID=UPI003F44ED79
MILMVIILFLLFLFLGVPLYIALGAPAILYFVLNDIPLNMISYTIFTANNSFTLIAVPMFILMGILINNLGGTSRIYHFTKVLLRNRPGYSAKLNVILSLIFSGMSGAALADVAGLGKIQVKAMEEEGFTREYSSALAVSTATVGPIFPPSIPLIIYAMVAQVSAIKALLAGMLPAIMIAGFMFIFVLITIPAQLKGKYSENIVVNTIKKGELPRATLKALPFLLAAPIVIGGMLFGIFSPSEAGVVGVLYLIVVSIFQGEFRLQNFLNGLKETVVNSAAIILIVSSGALITKALVLERLPETATDFILNLTTDPILIIITINILLLTLGMFMETISSLILVTPILLPIAAEIGLDPVHLGVIVVLNLMIGMITPPFGISLFTISKVTNVSLWGVFKSLIPQYIPLVVSLLLVSFIPFLSLWIPNLFL